jgi:hypothetical protein
MLLAFSKTVVADVADLEHAVAQIPDTVSFEAQAFVLRVGSDLWTDICSSGAQVRDALASQAQLVAARAPGIEVYLMPDGHSCAEETPVQTIDREPRLFVDSKGALVFDSKICKTELIRQQDLQDCIESTKTRCVVCSGAAYHFSLPSGAHANQFLRLAEAFVDLQTVDRIAYWVALDIQRQLSPFQKTKPILLVDNPSMLVLAARVQLLVDQRLKVVAFPAYPSDVETTTASFDLIRRQGESGAQTFVLIGVASTGRLASLIQQWGKSPPQELQVVVLYAMRKIPLTTVLCHLDLPEYKHFSSKNECQLCDSESSPVSIHPSNYMVGYAPTESVHVPAYLFEKQKPFIDRWGSRSGVLRAHFDDPNEATSRHHAFYVDVASLLQQPDFLDEVKAKVRSFDPQPELVVVPDHDCALRIGELISQELGIPLLHLTTSMLVKREGPVDPHLVLAKSILVVDDVFITGSKLDSINKFLREQHANRAPRLQRIFYFTLLATPASQESHVRRCRALTLNHSWQSTVEHLYEFPLPDWHEIDHCPWCIEASDLQRIAQCQDELDGPLLTRLAHLANRRIGLADEVFFASDIAAGVPNLGSQSAVLPESAAPLQVLFACASAVQQLRHSAKGRLDANQFPAPSFLAKRVLSEHYTERLIWLALLRSVRANELDEGLRDFLKQTAIDTRDGQKQLIQNELAVAWLAGKLGAIELSPECQRFFADSGVSSDALFKTGLVNSSPVVK